MAGFCTLTKIYRLITFAQGTSALLEALPGVSQEDFHVVMIGLDGAGKTTALYRSQCSLFI